MSVNLFQITSICKMAAEGDDDGEASLSDYIDKLSMSAKMDFCDGIVHNFNYTQCDIDARLFGKLNDIASEYSSNKKKALFNMVKCINPDFEVSNMQNYIRKYCNVMKKIEKEKDELVKEKLLDGTIITFTSPWAKLEEIFDIEKLKQGEIVSIGDNIEISNEIFIKIGEFKYKFKSLTWNKIAAWAADKFKIPQPSKQALSHDLMTLVKKRYLLRNKSEERLEMFKQMYNFPVPQNLVPHNLVITEPAAAEVTVEERQYEEMLLRELYFSYSQMAEMSVVIERQNEEIRKVADIAEDKEKASNLLHYELAKFKRKHEKLQERLSDVISKYSPRNSNKREKSRDRKIESQRNEIFDLERANSELTSKLDDALKKVEKERQRFYYLQRKISEKEEGSNSAAHNEKGQNDEIAFLQNKCSEYEERIEEIMADRVFNVFEDGRYNDDIRKVYYDLLSMNVSIENCQHVVRTVLEKLAKIKVGRLPQKTVASMMMVEARLLASVRGAEAMLEGSRNVLHTDGTKKRFEELASFQVTTESGSYSLGMEDMLSGSASCFLDAFRNVLSEMAALLVPESQKDEKVAKLIASIKNVMTDRHIVNSSLVEQLSSWRKEMLPLVIENYNDLPICEQEKFAKMNHVFCGLHVIHNLGVAAESAVKEWVKIATMVDKHAGFNTKNSRVYDMLFEISKICSSTHGDQRNGKALAWIDYLSNKGKENKIVSFLHHRFNIFFVLGGAVYYHADDLEDFLRNTQESENFLLQSVLADIGNKVYLAGFRALGLFNKLVSGPLFRLIEEEGHIFALNEVWSKLKNALDDCCRCADAFLEGKCLLAGGKVSDDVVYRKLVAESGDAELDCLTRECLEIICCSCSVLVERQLADQLPGGKFHVPDEAVYEETALCPRSNVLSERDFAQMDRKVKQKPNISTLAASGMIMYVNNRTGAWLCRKDDESQQRLLQQVVTLAPELVKSFKEKRRDLLQKRIGKQQKVRMEKEVSKQSAADEKKALTISLSKINGLWDTEESIEDNISNVSVSEQRKRLKLQIDFRKKVLGQSHSDLKVFNMGSAIGGKYQQHSIETLKSNLLSIIEFNKKGVTERAEVIQSPDIRPEQERKRKLLEIKRKLKEKEQDRVRACNSKQGKYPKLFGKYINHRWDSGWFKGKVVACLDDDEYHPDCTFEVEYEGYEGKYEVELLKDFEKNWVVIIGSVATIDKRNEMLANEQESEQAMITEEQPSQEVKCPTFFGKRIRHKWNLDGKDEWFHGLVVGVLDEDEYSTDCEFQVEYDDDDDEQPTVVKLIEDWQLGWVEFESKRRKRK